MRRFFIKRPHKPNYFRTAIASVPGSRVRKSIANETDDIIKAAEQGDSDAQVTLGTLYSLGDGVPVDDKKAAEYYLLAAEQGLSIAQFFIGLHYREGSGVTLDENEALKWLTKAANQGLADAQFELGRLYDHDDSSVKNKKESIYWYRKAAEQGHADAQSFLGGHYALEDVRDYKEALKWLRLAAAQNSSLAESILAVCYENGYGVEENIQESRALFKRAAEHGEPHAAFMVSTYYFEGIEVSKDKTQAYKWLSIAIAGGCEMSEEDLHPRKADFSAEEIKQGEALAKEWLEKHPDYATK